MKKTIIIALLLLSFGNLYSQNYYYSKRTESIKYIDSNGKNKSKVIKANTGNFKLYFEKSGIDGKDVFTEYINDNDMGYYALVEKYSNKEFNGKLFEQGLYFSTDYQDGVIVANSLNKDRLIIFKGDKIIQYDK
jgi:hypothetical protein